MEELVSYFPEKVVQVVSNALFFAQEFCIYLMFLYFPSFVQKLLPLVPLLIFQELHHLLVVPQVLVPPIQKETNPTPYSLFSVLISKVLQKRTSIQFLLTVAIIELGNMKSVLVEEAFTTLILSSLTLLLLYNCVKEFVLS